MSRFALSGATLALLLATAPLSAQVPGSISLTPYAGYLRAGSIANGPVGTTLGAAGGLLIGGEAALTVIPGVAVIGNVGYSAPDLRVGAPIIGGFSVGRRTIWLYDAGLRLGAPVAGGRMAPFIEGGAGIMRQQVSIGPVASHSSNFAWHVGAGVTVPMGERLGFELRATDYVGRLDATAMTGLDLPTRTSHNLALSAGVRLGM